MLLYSEYSWLAEKPAKTNLKRQIIVAQKATPFASKGKLCHHGHLTFDILHINVFAILDCKLF